MQNSDISLQRLRDLIGVRARCHNCDCVVIEVLEDGPALVLENCAGETVIQPDQQGSAKRRVPQRFTISVMMEGDKKINPLVLDLLAQERDVARSDVRNTPGH